MHTLLFDLDGTLVDTAADLAAALNHGLAKIGRPPADVAAVRGMIGGGFANLVARGLEATGGPASDDDHAAAAAAALPYYEAHVADRSTAYPGVAAALEAFAGRGMAMAVCTNKPSRASADLLAALGLDRWLKVLVGGDTLPVKKPDPEMAFEALRRLGAAADGAVLVGDSATDVALARAAGLPVILVRGGYTDEPPETLGADAVVDGFAALDGALTTLS